MEIRQKKILDIILKNHIENAEPVSSKYISNVMGLSSATIRNIMAELEDEGYLEQPHTSAGRIPTERAYRLYVNDLLNEDEAGSYDLQRLTDELFSGYSSYSEILENASYAISRMTDYTSFVVYPRTHIYMDGVYHMLEQKEFNHIAAARKLIKALDEREKLLDMMNSYISQGTVNIHIGRENHNENFGTCSVITASYVVRKTIVGGVGIIGPVRMKYRRVVPLIKHIADTFSRMLERVV